jgi:integrase
VVSGAFATAAAAAGLADVVFHDLRASAKTNLLLAGANATAVDVALGHQLPGMSSIYVTLESQPGLLYRGCYRAWTPRLTVVKEAKTA